MNQDTFKGKIKEITGELKKKWGELTDDEIQRTKGNLESLSGLVQKKYGMAKDKASKDVNDFMARFEQDKEEKKQNFSDNVNDKIDRTKEKLN